MLLLILFPVYIKEDSASAVTGTANSSSTSLTLTASNTSANVTITPNSANGTFAMSSTNNEAKFSVTTNNYTGYELRIKADDDNGNLVNIDNGNTHTISSIPSSITKSSFDTTTYNNKWGYKPSKYLGPNSTIVTNTGDSALFLPSPTTTGTVLDHTTTPNTTANNYTIALGIRADYNTYAGTYSKTFTLVATANPTTYTINYNKNTTDSVSNMPATSTAGSTTATSITLPNIVPTRAHYSFLGWCSTTTTTSNGIDSCSGTVYNPNGAGTNLTYGIDQTTANTTTLYAMWKIDTFTCTKRYRRENADGSWEAYQQESSLTETINYGGSCSYTKTITNYRGASNAANGAQGSTSASNISADTTLSLDFYRNTYSLTVSAGSNTSDPTGSGTYRWGYAVPVSVTKNTDITCTSYGTPTWATTAGTAPAAGASTSFTMPTSNATITATSTASNVAQTITLSRSGGASGINIGGTNYTGSSVSLTCGTYNISGNYSSGYEFSSWSRANGVIVANTASASTTMTVSGAGTLTLNGKSSKLYLQNVTSATCPTTATTAYDSRDEEAYTIQKLADGKCWLLDNLRLDLTNATVKNNLTASTTNASATTLNYLKNGGGTDSDQYAMIGVITTWDNSQYRYSAPKIAASGTGDKGSWTKNTIASFAIGQSGSGKIGIYYNYCAASAGSYCYGDATTGYGAPSSNATEDICPAGWRMPTGGASGEYQALYTAYGNKVTFINALRTPLSGTFNNNSAYWQGQSGSFWSSTREGNYRMYYLGVGTSDIYLQERNQRYSGQSVRCVAK